MVSSPSHSQSHNTDTRANRPSPTLKIGMPSGEQQVPFLRLWYVSVQEQIRYLLISGGHSFLHTRTQCADQQCSNLTVDQRLCFRYIDGTSPCTSFIRNSKFLAILYGCTNRLMFDLVISPEARDCRDAAPLWSYYNGNLRFVT